MHTSQKKDVKMYGFKEIICILPTVKIYTAFQNLKKLNSLKLQTGSYSHHKCDFAKSYRIGVVKEGLYRINTKYQFLYKEYKTSIHGGLE